MRFAGVAPSPVITWLAVMISPVALYMTPVPTASTVPVRDWERTAVTPTTLGWSFRATETASAEGRGIVVVLVGVGRREVDGGAAVPGGRTGLVVGGLGDCVAREA